MYRLLLPLIFAACSAAPAATGPTQDAGLVHDTPVDSLIEDLTDAQVQVDAAPPEPTTTLWSVNLSNGEEIVGEHIATYNQNRWWDQRPALTHALFDLASLQAYPNDRSVVLIDHSEIDAISAFEQAGTKPYRQALRDHNIVLERPPLDDVSLVFTGHESYHLEENGYGDFAWDLVQTDNTGARYTGDGLENEDYLVWGAPVYLPTAGIVVEVERDGTDNTPGTYPEQAINNLVGVHLGGSYYVYLLHLQAGSIPAEVKVDAYLNAGTLIGNVGNSGVTLEPHLHLTVLWYDANAEPARSWSVPSEFHNLWMAQTPDGPSHQYPFLDPATGMYISANEF